MNHPQHIYNIILLCATGGLILVLTKKIFGQNFTFRYRYKFLCKPLNYVTQPLKSSSQIETTTQFLLNSLIAVLKCFSASCGSGAFWESSSLRSPSSRLTRNFYNWSSSGKLHTSVGRFLLAGVQPSCLLFRWQSKKSLTADLWEEWSCTFGMKTRDLHSSQTLILMLTLTPQNQNTITWKILAELKMIDA